MGKNIKSRSQRLSELIRREIKQEVRNQLNELRERDTMFGPSKDDRSELSRQQMELWFGSDAMPTNRNEESSKVDRSELLKRQREWWLGSDALAMPTNRNEESSKANWTEDLMRWDVDMFAGPPDPKAEANNSKEKKESETTSKNQGKRTKR